MQKILHKTLFAAVLVLLATACKKEETKIFFEGGSAPALTADRSKILLSSDNAAKLAVAFTWTNPNYNFTTGLSSQDVTYLLQIDTVGANFTNPKKQEISISKDLGVNLTVLELNNYLIKMALKAEVPHDLEMRVVASLKGAVPVVSNVVKFSSVIPYKDYVVKPPDGNELFIIGGATPDGWGNPVSDKQKLTTIEKGLYEITLKLTGGQSYLFLPVNGSWSAKYGGTGANNTNNPISDAFKPDGGDLIAPPVTGTYKIVVDFVVGRFTLTKQ